jgi:hypothetical protein
MIDSDATSPDFPTFQQQGQDSLQISTAGSQVDSDASFWATPAHSIASYEAFLRELPGLMKTNLGQCAAYQDGIRMGIGLRRREFFKQMYDLGCDPARLLFFTIEPQEPHEIELLSPDLTTE